MEFDGQIVVVTGGATGIGKQVCLSFYENGAKVAILDVNREKGTELSHWIHSQGGASSFFEVDVSDMNQVENAVSQITNHLGPIDVLVNNAGITNTKLMETMSSEEWTKVIQVNLTGTFNCSSAVIKSMKEKGSGKIVNMSSLAGKRISFAGGIGYTASKAGIIGFTRHLAYEMSPYGINVNCVCPGGTLTPLYESITTEEMLAERTSMIPLGRLCSPKDIADAVLFLSSPRASMIQGVALDVDGGSMLGWYNVNEYYERRNKITEKRGS